MDERKTTRLAWSLKHKLQDNIIGPAKLSLNVPHKALTWVNISDREPDAD